MNGSYYNTPIFPGTPLPSGTPNQQMAPTVEKSLLGAAVSVEDEQSYIENILRFNRGKIGKFYFSFPDSIEWRDKVFTGIIENAGRDHLIISDPNTGIWHFLRMIYLDYVDFDEPIIFRPQQLGQIK